MELKPDLVEYVWGKIPDNARSTSIFILQGDSTSEQTRADVKGLLRTLGERYAQLLVLHPPYHDIIKFSGIEADLSNAPTLEAFLELFSKAARNGYELLQPGRFAVLVIGDKYEDGELVPLGFYCMQRMNEVGFRTKAIVIKNIEGNERGKGRANNLWRYRALVGGFYIFKHEYVMIFRKPGVARYRSESR